MRLFSKRLSFQTEPRKLKRSRKSISKRKRYYEVSDFENELTNDFYEEAITSRSSPSSTNVELPLDFNDNSGNFVRTMRIIKRESSRTFMMIKDSSYLDNNLKGSSPIENSLKYSSQDFYLEKNAKERAIYFACRIKKQLPSIFSGCQLVLSKEKGPGTIPEPSPIDITKMIADRLFTLTYINELMPSFSQERMKILEKLDLKLSKQGDLKLSQKVGGHEAFFAFRYTLDHYFKHNILPSQKTLMVEKARRIIQDCIESEEKLSYSERECMYCFHRLMSGINWNQGDLEPTLRDLHE